MTTKVIEIGGNENILYPDGYACKRATFYGVSADDKPVENAHNADIFYEMDTKKVYLFDESNSVWLEQ